MLNRKSEALVYPKFYFYAICSLVFLLLSRIIAIVFVPLNDATEARYGEIARKMLETGDWITPQHDYGVPFWAKPPLSIWFSAGSMKVFGVNEFAARLPGLLLSLGILWLVWGVIKKQSGSLAALIAVLVLSGTLYFFLDAGTVMTDPTLLLCTTLAIVSFWRALDEEARIWSYLFFIALGLGLLAKGPIAVILVGMPIFFWVLWRNQWRNLWKKLPWVSGSLLTLAIALPWYLIAERKTPGFLSYFILGEHIQRFLVPGWTGDKYGMAHDAYWGMIWVYAAVGIFPWCFVGCYWIAKYWKKIPSLCQDDTGWMSYLVLCTLAPLLFFTFSSNIIYPYVFPILPAYALLFSEFWMRTMHSPKHMDLIAGLSISCGVIFLIGVCLFQLKPEWISKTQKPLIGAWINQHPQKGSNLVYWNDKLEFSAQFYSAGKAKSTGSLEELCQFLSNNLENYVIINDQKVTQIPKPLYSQFIPIKTMKISGNNMILMRTPVLTC